LARAERAALSRLGPDGLVDLMIRFGPRGRGVVPGGLSLGALKAKPHGVDLGPLEPCLLRRLGTRDHRIHLVPPRFAADVERLRRELDAPVPALVLIGRRQLRSNNSWMHNSERLVKGPERCTLLVHPDDAAARGLGEGARVVLRSRVGAVEVPVALDAGMMRGVVSLPHGFGHGRPGTRLSVAAAHAGASINDVLDDGVFDELTGTAALNGIAVELSPAGGAD
jgi:anaerobic selenocysteine-containing dehydrogenase